MKVISWDFDETLWDNRKNCPIEKSLQLFNAQRAEPDTICIITTFRQWRYVREIKKLFPDVKVVATEGEDKDIYLLNLKVNKHYDDDYFTCCQLIGTKCRPVWVCTAEEAKDANGMETFIID